MSKLWDVVIDVDFYKGTSKVLSFKCPRSGVKPYISLSTQQVDGNICFQTLLTIGNLDIEQSELRTWTRMVISCGYASDPTGMQVLDCPILTAWRSAPLPNGESVFSGLAVGSVGGFLTGKEINIQFVSTYITIGKLIESVCNAVVSDYTVIDYSELESNWEIWDLEIATPVKSCYAENGLSLLRWLESVLATVSSGSIKVFITNEKVIFRTSQSENPEEIKDYIDIDYVTDASFTGSLLQVNAPWNPRVTPGATIRMLTNFYTGQNLPNEMDIQGINYRSQSDKYVIIMMTYKCDTESTPSMSFSAIRIEDMKGKKLREVGYINTEDIEAVPTSVTSAVQDRIADTNTINLMLGVGAAKKSQAINERNLATAASASDSYEVYVPAKPTDKNDIKALYDCILPFTPAGVKNIDDYDVRDFGGLLEKMYGTAPLVTISSQQAKAIATANPGIKEQMLLGLQIYARHLVPYMYAAVYQQYVFMKSRENPISLKKVFSLSRHWSNFSVPMVSVETILYRSHSFWIQASNSKYTSGVQRLICQILGGLVNG